MTVDPANCRLCGVPLASGNQFHEFTANKEIYPALAWSANLPVGFIASGQGNLANVTVTSAATVNPIGVTVVTFGPGLLTQVKPGMTFITQPTSPNRFNQQNYFVLSVDYVNGTVTIPAPGLRRSANSLPCLFFGSYGNISGPGLPPNGQRAG